MGIKPWYPYIKIHCYREVEMVAVVAALKIKLVVASSTILLPRFMCGHIYIKYID